MLARTSRHRVASTIATPGGLPSPVLDECGLAESYTKKMREQLTLKSRLVKTRRQAGHEGGTNPVKPGTAASIRLQNPNAVNPSNTLAGGSTPRVPCGLAASAPVSSLSRVWPSRRQRVSSSPPPAEPCLYLAAGRRNGPASQPLRDDRLPDSSLGSTTLAEKAAVPQCISSVRRKAAQIRRA